MIATHTTIPTPIPIPIKPKDCNEELSRMSVSANVCVKNACMRVTTRNETNNVHTNESYEKFICIYVDIYVLVNKLYIIYIYIYRIFIILYRCCVGVY